MKPLPPNDRDEAEPARVRPGAVLGGVLVALLLGGLAWLATDVPSDAAPVSPLQQAVRLPDVWTPATPPSAVMPAVPVAIPASAPAGLPPGWVEVCGVGAMSEADFIARASEPGVLVQQQAARGRVVGALRASADDTARAVGLALAAAGGPAEADEAEQCTGPACPAEPRRTESAAARQRRIAAHAPLRDQLARLALNTREATAYGLAHTVCSGAGRQDTGSACRLVSAERWAQLDPANGAAWLAVAAEARTRGDAAGLNEALHRAGQARTFQQGGDAHVRAVAERLPADVAEADALEALWQAFLLDDAPAAMATAAEACAGPALRDPYRHQLCAALADNLALRSTSLLQLAVAPAIGRRTGWSPERQEALRAERDALTQAQAATLGDVSASCESLRRHIRHFVAVGRAGELGAMRETLRASGRTLDDWAREARAERVDVLRAADSAASVPLER